mmetsp:Transcript_6437/g.15876  ORF Transcript_6437/g.15876 Transcript_6437/m.15876 type:complete len:243 (+) Transcript_6437:588-1316(+)
MPRSARALGGLGLLSGGFFFHFRLSCILARRMMSSASSFPKESSRSPYKALASSAASCASFQLSRCMWASAMASCAAASGPMSSNFSAISRDSLAACSAASPSSSIKYRPDNWSNAQAWLEESLRLSHADAANKARFKASSRISGGGGMPLWVCSRTIPICMSTRAWSTKASPLWSPCRWQISSALRHLPSAARSPAPCASSAEPAILRAFASPEGLPTPWNKACAFSAAFKLSLKLKECSN